MEPIVATTSGKVRGASAKGVYVFKGVPYGASTAGENRFMPPVRPPQWDGVRDALQYGPMAMQNAHRDRTYRRVLHGIYPEVNYPMSEDCLSLNIWSPELGRENKRPVMVWLHPGGFDIGAGNSDWSEGTNLARKGDVVVVSLNHRLDIFGFLYLGDMAGARYQESGNVGMLDIVAALTWVQENISDFGGDPKNVTLFGESGGGGKVSVLMAMPAAKGLFHKAIIQSGALIRATPREEATPLTLGVLEKLGITPGDISKLHQLPPEALLAIPRKYKVRPVVAGRSLPRHPFDPDAPAVSAEVPMLMGTTGNEATYYCLSDSVPLLNDTNTLRRRLVESFHNFGVADNAVADALIKINHALYPTMSPTEAFISIGTGIFFDDATIQAQAKAAAGKAPVFMYLFTWEAPEYTGSYKSCHTFEIPFVFDNVHAAPQWYESKRDPRLDELATTLSKAWATFAHRGDPSHSHMPQWSPYTANERATMILDYACRSVLDPKREQRLEFEKLRSVRVPRFTTINPS